MLRAFLERDEEGRLVLSPEELHHLVKVRRLGRGESFVGLDGLGGSFLCGLRRAGRDWSLGVLEELPHWMGESPLSLTLAIALLKSDRMDWVIQKATELGVVRVVPLLTRRTEVKLSAASQQRRLRRWRRIAVEALKQSGRSRIPDMEAAIPLEDFCAADAGQWRLAMDEASRLPLSELVDGAGRPSSATLYVGPEGGWDEDDRRQFQHYAIPEISLGSRILRAETAALAGLAILQSLWGDMAGMSPTPETSRSQRSPEENS